jgi:hypothetical protein
MKRLLISLFAVIVCLTSCQLNSTADARDEAQQEQMLSEAQRETGIPAVHNFQEKKLYKMIYELRDQADLQTYTYLQAELTGKLIYIGRSIGFGIPYSTQYTNPMKQVSNYRDSVAIPQADPNGLFSPASAAGTWVMLIDETTGKPHPVYFEPNVVVSPFKLTEAK